MAEMNDFEAIIETIKIIEEEKNELVERALKEQRKVAPQTTPTIYEINAMIGSFKLYRMMWYSINDHLIDSKKQILETDEFKNVYKEDVKKLQSYRNYLVGLVYHYLKNQDLELFEEEVPPLIEQSHANVIQELKDSDFEWGDSLEDNSAVQGRSQEDWEGNDPLIWIYFFPVEEKAELKKKIEKDLKKLGARKEMALSLRNFPDALEKLTGNSLKGRLQNRKGKFSGYILEKVIDILFEDTADFEFFDSVLLHELTHDFLKRKYGGNNLSTVDEAFAQFTDIYYRKGVNFDHEPSDYELYRENYSADPEDIWWMVEIIREKAKEIEVEESDLSVIDWARISEVKIHNQGLDSRIQFLEFFTPGKLQDELKAFDSIVHEEMSPILDRIKDHIRNIDEVKGRKHLPEEKKEAIVNTVKKSKVDYERLNNVKEMPDETLREIEARTVKEKGTFGYEEEIIFEVLQEKVDEIESLMNDLETLAEELDDIGADTENKTQDLIGDIRNLNQLRDDLKNILN